MAKGNRIKRKRVVKEKENNIESQNEKIIINERDLAKNKARIVRS